MATESFEKNGIGWQLQQLQQRVGEWWEWQTNQLDRNMPEDIWPSWLDLPLLWGIIKGIFGVLLVALLVLLSWQIWRGLRRYFSRLKSRTGDGVRVSIEPNLSVTNWLKRSQQFQQQGDYYQACRCLYLAMLQKLNDTGAIPHQGSRTDGEYLQTLRALQSLSDDRAYRTLFMTHQRLCFGSLEASPSVLEDCQRAYRSLDRPSTIEGEEA